VGTTTPGQPTGKGELFLPKPFVSSWKKGTPMVKFWGKKRNHLIN
jgi:hypothetical protein